jgi:aminopeptidase N
MADANGRDLTQFERWYSQAGTPVVSAATSYDAQARTYEITLTQRCPATPGQPKKLAFHIPVAVGLLGADGKDLPLNEQGQTTVVLELTEKSHVFRFTDIAEEPTPSLLRDFSAPVVLEYDYTDAQLLHLFSHDSDPVNRWEAGQRLAMERLLALTGAIQRGEEPTLDETFTDALRTLLKDDSLDPAFRELALTLPSETVIAEKMEVVDPQAIHAARRFLRRGIAAALKDDLLAAYEANQTPGAYSPDAVSAGKRALKNLALAYLLVAPGEQEVAAALSALIHSGQPEREQPEGGQPKHAAAPLQRFYEDFSREALVVDKWFAMQATAPGTDVAAVRQLMEHPAFTLKNPNRARSLIFSFCNGNPSQFHAPDGSAYAFWAEQVIALDALNPQVAARLARSMDRWRRYVPALQVHMRTALETVAARVSLSNDVLEVVSKALAN